MAMPKIAIKLLVLPLVVAVTYAVTSYATNGRLYAQRPSGKKTLQRGTPQRSAPLQAELAPPEMVARRSTAEDIAWSNAQLATLGKVHPHSKSESRTVEYLLASDAHGVKVYQKVKLLDKNPKIGYMWSVRIVNMIDDSDVSLRHYDQQIFYMADEQYHFSAFTDSIPVPPGAYRVVLSLYRLKPGLDLDKAARDNVYADPFLASRLSQKVIVN